MSRIFKCPPVQGIYYYTVFREEAENFGEISGGNENPGGGGEEISEYLESGVPMAGYSPKEVAAPHMKIEETAKPDISEEEARAEIEKMVQQGYLEGKAEAEAQYKELIEGASEKINRVEMQAKIFLQQARQRAREILSASEGNMVELAVAVAEKLIKGQLKTSPSTVVGIVREAIKKLPDDESMGIYVSAEDLAICLSELGKSGDQQQIREILSDGELIQGSCRVESESGTVEYLLDEELKKIREALLEIVPADELAELKGEKELSYDRH